MTDLLKGILIVLAVVAGLGLFYAGVVAIEPDEHLYCGRVVEKFRTDAGYKSHSEAHVVFYCDSIKKNIDVETSFNCYANVAVGQEVCFGLTDYQIHK